MAKPVVLLTNSIDPHGAERLSQYAELRMTPATDAAALREAARGTSAIIVRAKLPDDIFAGAPEMRGVVRHGAGVDFIPVEIASQLGIAVCNAPGANALSVAEYIVGQCISLAHRLTRVHVGLHRDGWAKARPIGDGAVEVAGKTVGIVGVGAIGGNVARICHFGLGMKVLGNRRRLSDLPAHVTPAALDDLIAASDFLVLACPLTDETTGLISARRIALMKRSAFLVNVSRGAVIEEPALISALQEQRIAGAALDVFATQPLPADSPLLKLDNVITTPHVSGISIESMQRMSAIAVDETLRFLRGERPVNFVNAAAWPAIEARWTRLGRAIPN